MASSESATVRHQNDISVSPKECGICSNEYDEKMRCPRMLNCSHTLCSECIERLIRDSTKECPFCRRHFVASSSKDVNVNHSTLDFLRYFAELELNENSSKPKETEGFPCEADPHEASPCEMKMTTRKNEVLKVNTTLSGECHGVRSEYERIRAKVNYLEELISQENTLIKNEILPKIHVVISQNDETLQNLRERELTFQMRDKLAEEKIKLLSKVEDKLKTCAADQYEEICTFLDDSEGMHPAIAELLKNAKESVTEGKEALKQDQEDAERASDLMRNILENLKLVLEPDKDIISKEESLGEILIAALHTMTVPMKLLFQIRKIYAVRNLMGVRMFAKISLKDNIIFLHAVKDEPAPPNAFLMKYVDVIGLTNQQLRRAFFELTRVSSGECLGTMTIRTIASTLESKFLQTCMGAFQSSFLNEKGRSVQYKGTPHERVRFGDWGEEVYSPFEGDRRSRSQWRAGKVRGRTYEDTAMFEIFTQDNPEYNLSSLGEVESGLNILQKAVSNGYVEDIIISDCGIVVKSCD